MSREEVLVRMQSIFSDIFGDDCIQINEQTSPDDIEAWDSLASVSILEAVREEFSISFEIDDIVFINNIGEMMDIILEKSL